jgi:primosomal protein N'
MARPRVVDCPICDSDLTLDKTDKPGDEVYCHYCGAPITIAKISDDDEVEIEEY